MKQRFLSLGVGWVLVVCLGLLPAPLQAHPWPQEQAPGQQEAPEPSSPDSPSTPMTEESAPTEPPKEPTPLKPNEDRPRVDKSQEDQPQEDQAKPQEDQAKPKEDQAKPKEDQAKPQEDQAKPKDDKPQGSSNETENENEGENSNRSRFSIPRMARDDHKQESKRSKEFVELVKPLVASAEASTVKVLNGNRLISLGTVVDRNGLILTKASELRGELQCGFGDGQKVPAVVIGVHQDTDLALLRVARSDLNPIHWGQDGPPIVGQWVVSPVIDSNVLQIGIVGVNARKIPPSSPFLGIGPPLTGSNEGDGAKIDSVQPKTPADDADLMVGDIITKIDDVEIKGWDDLRRTLGQYDPKDEITLTVQRGDQELKIKAVLGDREKIEREARGGNRVPGAERSNMQNNMGSQPSQRRKDFPLAFQHDLMLNKTHCGGPVVNLNGQVVGINIARAGRVDSLALPVNIVLPVLEMLKSGELAPEKINEARLVEVDKEIQEVGSKLGQLKDPGALEGQVQIEKARQEELDRARAEMKKAMDELENRIKVVELKKENFEKELKSIRNERNSLERRKNNLERERKGLATGVN